MATAESSFNLPKPPPFLLGAGLLYWGWQTGFPVAGLVMAVVLEAARWVVARWEFSDQDFNRIWVFCTLTLIGSVIYAFSNEGLADFRGRPVSSRTNSSGLAQTSLESGETKKGRSPISRRLLARPYFFSRSPWRNNRNCAKRT